MNPKLKLALNILASAVSGGLYIPIWIGWVIYQNWHKAEVSKYQNGELIKKIKFEISDIEETLIHHLALDKWLTKLDSELPKNGTIVKIPSVRLYESRAGESITSTSGTLQAQTKTGTVGIGTKLGPVGVGLAASKGETRGTISSSSVTRAGKDKMTKIDDGELILAADSIAFAGSQFSRSVPFDLLLTWQVNQNEIIISSKNSEKNWLLALNSDSVAQSIGRMLDYLVDSNDIDSSSGQESKLVEELKNSNSREINLLRVELSQKSETLIALDPPPIPTNTD